MVIGLLGIIVMMQVFSVFEGQKRTTGGGDDAISSGAVSLYGVQRNMQQSGWGISSVEVIGCTVTGLLFGGAALPLIPVTINSPLITGQDANTDTLLIVSGNAGPGSVEGVTIDAVPAAGQLSGGENANGFLVGERVVAVPQARPSPCTGVNHGYGGGEPECSGDRWFCRHRSRDKFNLGPAPTVRAYAVRNQNLTVCDYTANDAAWLPITEMRVRVPVANNAGRACARNMVGIPVLQQWMVWSMCGIEQGRFPLFRPATPANACALIRALPCASRWLHAASRKNCGLAGADRACHPGSTLVGRQRHRVVRQHQCCGSSGCRDGGLPGLPRPGPDGAGFSLPSIPRPSCRCVTYMPRLRAEWFRR
ncbi:MAG: hypothetical protein IPP85_11315 [Propionivibrio sp.]|nr:hypothetical protein [Propionivibrio sp.]